MQKLNREIMMQQSLYDLLCRINDGIKVGCDCILEVFGDAPSDERCEMYGGKCNECIADYLNEYPF